MIEASRICGAVLDESKTRLQVDMQTVDHGVLEAGCTGGASRSILAVSLDDDCIRRRWLEDVPVVE